MTFNPLRFSHILNTLTCQSKYCWNPNFHAESRFERLPSHSFSLLIGRLSSPMVFEEPRDLFERLRGPFGNPLSLYKCVLGLFRHDVVHYDCYASFALFLQCIISARASKYSKSMTRDLMAVSASSVWMVAPLAIFTRFKKCYNFADVSLLSLDDLFVLN